MPIPGRDDGDEFRAMGYVAVYAAYVEEYVGECFNFLEQFDPEGGDHPWQSARRIESCRRAIKSLPRHATLTEIDAALASAKRVLKDRNLAIHSPLYAVPGRGNIRKNVRPERVRFVTADEIYDLAEELKDVADLLIASSVRLPRAIREARNP